MCGGVGAEVSECVGGGQRRMSVWGVGAEVSECGG